MLSVLKQTAREFSEDACTRMAAALAYFTVFALPPVFVILVMAFGLYYRTIGHGGEEAARSELRRQIGLIAGPGATGQVEAMLSNAGAKGGEWWRWLLGIAGVLLGATGLVAALQATLNEVWKVRPGPSERGAGGFLKRRAVALGMILAVGFLLLASTLLSTWAGAVIGAGGKAAGEAVSFLVVWVLFAAMFKFLPDAETPWKDVAAGAALTAALFSIGKYVLTAYLARAGFASQFGAAAASLAALFAFIYYSSLILLAGAEFTQVRARRSGGVRPRAGAIEPGRSNLS